MRGVKLPGWLGSTPNVWRRKQTPESPVVATPYEVVCCRGIFIPIDRAIISETLITALQGQDYEAIERDLLDRVIRRGDVILEIGAGCGYISTYCALREVASVTCVEANPELIPIIRETHRINGVTATVHNEVLGAEDGTADFYVSPDFWASSTIPTHQTPKAIRVKKTRFQRRLDEIHPNLLVVDIEGGEIDLFDGVDLSSVNRIMVDLHQSVIGRAGMKRVFDTLSAAGFHYHERHSMLNVVTFFHITR
jgi:FkbM family methyltransferase